jgi:NADH-quinone oxidoreductase subunit L
MTFLIGTLAITGFPLLSGFYSKDEILAVAFSQNIGLYILILISVIMTAMYMFRLYFVTFHGTYRGSKETESHIHEGPPSMTIPLVVLAILSVVGGVINLPGVWLKNQAHWLSHYLEHNTAGLRRIVSDHLADTTVMMLMVVAILVTLSVLAISYMIYVKKDSLPVEDAQLSGWEKLSANKLYVDEIYNFLFVRPIQWMSEKGYSFFEIYFLNGIVLVITKGIVATGERVKKWQSGYANWYVLWMVSGIVGLIVYYLVKI